MVRMQGLFVCGLIILNIVFLNGFEYMDNEDVSVEEQLQTDLEYEIYKTFEETAKEHSVKYGLIRKLNAKRPLNQSSKHRIFFIFSFFEY